MGIAMSRHCEELTDEAIRKDTGRLTASRLLRSVRNEAFASLLKRAS